MEIIITQWALDSYLELKRKQTITSAEYWKKIRPDVLLLKDYPKPPKFNDGKFWSIASDKSGNKLDHGFKMKWHQIGNGKIQLRLGVAMLDNAILCEAYHKQNDKQEKRKLAKFKTYIQLIQNGRYISRGKL